MSIGFLIDPDTPMVWRGPMAVQALNQMLQGHRLGRPRLPDHRHAPGTGDIQLTLSQSVPVTGAVIVTTPQDIALLDARKGVKMFEKVNVPILGVVENMSIHICSKCGHEEHIFGQGGGEKMCADFKVPNSSVRCRSTSDPHRGRQRRAHRGRRSDGRIAEIYKQIARKVAVRIAERSKDMTHKFPNIVFKSA